MIINKEATIFISNIIFLHDHDHDHTNFPQLNQILFFVHFSKEKTTRSNRNTIKLLNKLYSILLC